MSCHKMFLIRRKLYLTWSQFDKNNVIQTTNKLYREREQRTLSTELFKTQSQLNHCVAKWFTVLNCSNRIANHLIQNGTSKCVSRIILSAPGIKIIQLRQGCIDQRGGTPPPTNRTLYVYIFIYIYIYILGMARYTDVTVRYVPRFGGHSSISIQQEQKRNLLCSVSFHLFWTDNSLN